MAENVAWKRCLYQPNDIVVKAGELSQSLFFIEEGHLRVTGRVELDHNRHIQPGIAELTENMIFGETCLHRSHPRIATVIAVTDSVVLEINGERLAVFLDDHPVQGYLFYKQLFEILITRLGKVNHTVESLMAWGIKNHEIDQYL